MHRAQAIGPAAQTGFTLVELMIALVVAGILAAVAIPSYARLIDRSRAKDAAADLSALALNLENRYQLQLSYPVNASETTATTTMFTAWSPTQASHFSYSLVSTASSYTLYAKGQGRLSGCNLSLSHDNRRSVSAACGFSSW
ncbi:MAG: type IV pilin protein [Roseateles sp.]